MIFFVNGPLYGYRASASMKVSKRTGRKYGGVFDPRFRAFKHGVLIDAMAEGWRRVASGPDAIYRLSVKVLWKHGPRIDWKNVYGLIEDCLFEDDRYVFPAPGSDVKIDTGEEKAIVEVWKEAP